MNESDQMTQAPLERTILAASLACFVTLTLFYLAAGSWLNAIENLWVRLLICSLPPILASFLALYRSGCFPAIKGPKRACLAFLFSGAILVVVVFSVGVLFFVLLLGLNAVSGGFHP